MTLKRKLLYWGYSFSQEHDFKRMRERRAKFYADLLKDAKMAGLLQKSPQ